MNSRVNLDVFPNRTAGRIENTLTDINVWSHRAAFENVPGEFDGYMREALPFVRRVQFMQATGGSPERDLFADPADSSARDDYDFSPLISSCRNALSQGVKPQIKTGGVPEKLSSRPENGAFGMNVRPPEDFSEYYGYIRAMALALREEFGAEEVRTWRWGVLTEYENGDWFKAESSPEAAAEESFSAFCRLYDTTAAALSDALGEGLDIGAHSMSVTSGLWDERRFIDHCVYGRNLCTGGVGAPLKYLAVSFYDERAGAGLRDLSATISRVRSHADRRGLRLKYGVDEGRILFGRKGKDAADLVARAVGTSWQGAYDARLLRQMAENGISWFSAWAYTSAGLWGGLPTVSLHVAREFYKLTGMDRAETMISGNVGEGSEVGALAGSRDGAVGVMVYNFKQDPAASGRAGLSLSVFTGEDGEYAVSSTVVGDESNFFPAWEADCKAAGIGDECFSWSPDSAQVETNISGEARELWQKNAERYAKAAVLKRRETVEKAAFGRLMLDETVPAHGVVFFEIRKI